MHCKQCGFVNGEDDHRCLRCGRRLAGVVIAAPPGYAGANALALVPVWDPNETQDFIPAHRSGAAAQHTAQSAAQAAAPAAAQAQPAQPSLFPPTPGNVIPFDQIQRQRAERSGVVAPASPSIPAAPPVAPAAARPAKRAAKAPTNQGSLDFLPSAQAQRTLKTAVPAQIYCEQLVATPQHRFFASAVDGAMILLGFGLFTGIVELSGSGFGAGKLFWLAMGASLMLLSLFYGLIWAIAGRETAGMDWSDLQLITFDGFPVDARTRAVRFASTWLSFCSGGLGLVWAVADEENLTWHDHISKSFPTFREEPRNFVRQRH